MRRTVLALACIVLWTASPSTDAAAQESRCADCHFANPDEPAERHLDDWDLSPHGRNAVGCERCHGGDATSFEPFIAHQGVLNSRNPASPVHPWNLPATCGKCHVGPFVAFQKSQHYALLRAGDRQVPTCVTCHGEVAANLLSPKGLEQQCAQCHGAGKSAQNTDFPPQGRMMLEGVREARELLRQANRFIAEIDDPVRRAGLEQAAQQADVPLIEATNAGHAFVFDAMEERLATARERIAQLYQRLANP